jgi:hypothetical protein
MPMQRRRFLCTPALLLATPLATADAPYHVDYTPEAYAQALASGEPLLLDFYAPW